MKIDLDVDGRFKLVARPPGWELEVDGGDTRHYCRQPVDALAYMTEDIMSRAGADAVSCLQDLLSDLEKKLYLAADVVALAHSAAMVAKINKLADGSVDKAMSIMAGCHKNEIAIRSDRSELRLAARAILATGEGGDEIDDQERG